MKKKYIVKNKYEFDHIINTGIQLKSRYFVIYNIESNYIYSRFGISVGKKLGNAVFRNTYKRKIRAIIDTINKDELPKKDYIIILKRSGKDKTYLELQLDLTNALTNRKA
jgi:ribonuclease P protein component